jgi:hypothetical protein
VAAPSPVRHEHGVAEGRRSTVGSPTPGTFSDPTRPAPVICPDQSSPSPGTWVRVPPPQSSSRRARSTRHDPTTTRQRRWPRAHAAELRPDAVVHLAAVVGGSGRTGPNPAGSLRERHHGLERRSRGWRRRRSWSRHRVRVPEAHPVPFHEDDPERVPEEIQRPTGWRRSSRWCRPGHGTSTAPTPPPAARQLYGPGDNFDLETAMSSPA